MIGILVFNGLKFDTQLFWYTLFQKHIFQSSFTFPKLTIETLEQGVKYAINIVLACLLLTLTIFYALF